VKEDRITVSKDLLGENCPEFKIIPTTDIETNLSAYSSQKSPMMLYLFFIQCVKVFPSLFLNFSSKATVKKRGKTGSS
jgi:hypothetical protein